MAVFQLGTPSGVLGARFCDLKELQDCGSRRHRQSIPRKACEAKASVDILIDVLLLRAAFSNESLDQKINRVLLLHIPNSAARNNDDIVRVQFQGRNDECIAIYESERKTKKRNGQSV